MALGGDVPIQVGALVVDDAPSGPRRGEGHAHDLGTVLGELAHPLMAPKQFGQFGLR